MPPTGVLMWEPNPTVSRNYDDGASKPDDSEGPSNIHVSGCVLLHFDGHVAFQQIRWFIAEQANQPGLLWCDPGTVDGTF